MAPLTSNPLTIRGTACNDSAVSSPRLTNFSDSSKASRSVLSWARSNKLAATTRSSPCFWARSKDFFNSRSADFQSPRNSARLPWSLCPSAWCSGRSNSWVKIRIWRDRFSTCFLSPSANQAQPRCRNERTIPSVFPYFSLLEMLRLKNRIALP